MRERKSDATVAGARWIWVAGALLPLALIGCGTQQAADNRQQVAGERQEGAGDDVAAAMRQAGLPETFFFGGRVWRGHQVHRAEADDVATSPTTENAATGAGATGAAGDTTSTAQGTGTTGAAGGASGGKPDVGDYVPLPSMMVQGHQVYRRAGADEAVTDNIYLMASGATAGTTGTGTTPGDTTPGTGAAAGTTGETGTATAEGATGTAAGQQGQITFVEYDPTEETMEQVQLPQLLQATGLPQTVTHGGKTFTAREMAVYDPDVFDEFVQVKHEGDGQAAFQDDDKNELFLMAEIPADQMSTLMPRAGETGTTGTGTTGTGETGTTGTGTTGTGTTDAGTAATMAGGPVFIRYEEGKAGAGTTTNP